MVVNLQNLTFRYQRKTIIGNLTADFEHGHTYALFGTQGQGKTTIFDLIAGKLKPQEGKCRIFGQDPFDRNPELLERVFYLPEILYLPAVRGKTFIARYGKLYRDFSQADAWRILDAFDLDPSISLRKLPVTKARLFLLAFGFSCRPALILLDEPFAGTNRTQQTVIHNEIRRLRAMGACTIVATSLADRIKYLSDRMFFMRDNTNRLLLDRTRLGTLLSRGFAASMKEVPSDHFGAFRTAAGWQFLYRNASGRPGIVPLDLVCRSLSSQTHSCYDYLLERPIR